MLDEVDGFVRTMEGTARRAQLLYDALAESPPAAVEERLGQLDPKDATKAELVTALTNQLKVQRKMERQLQGFYDEMEKILIELDTVRGQPRVGVGVHRRREPAAARGRRARAARGGRRAGGGDERGVRAAVGMSETAERLREAIEAFGRGETVDPKFLAPGFELHQASSIIDTAGVFRGPGGLRESLGELHESFEDLTFEPERFIEAPGGEVVVLVHARGRGRGSGLEIDNHIAWVWTFRDGQAVRMVVYEEQADALAAVGLPSDS